MRFSAFFKQGKKLQIFFCLGAFTQEEQNFINKKAFFMLNFLNLKSFPSYLFFVVASSLSILYTVTERVLEKGKMGCGRAIKVFSEYLYLLFI